MFTTEFPPINNEDPSSNVIWAVPLSAVRTFTPISRLTISVRTSQSSEVLVRIPVAPIRGLSKIGGTTRSVSSKTSTLLGANVVVVLVVVVSSGTGVDSVSPPHIETIIDIIVILTMTFFLLIILSVYWMQLDCL